MYRTVPIWGVVAAVALLWPSHAIGALDGVPLDSRLEAIAIGLIFPILCWLHPRFLLTRFARTCAVTLLLIKVAAAFLLVQEGWCARFVMPAPLNFDANFTQLSWDARADWRHAVPRCSAIVARPYPDFPSFPAWFLNLGGPPDRPPRALVALTVDGYLSAPTNGSLAFGFPSGQQVLATVDDRAMDDVSRAVPMSSGIHHLVVRTLLTGDTWRFMPTWNGANLFQSVLTTVDSPRRLDGWLWRAVPVVGALIAMVLLVSWATSAAVYLALPPVAVAWLVGMSAITAVAGVINVHSAGRLAVLPLLAAALIPMPDRLKNARSAFLLIGVPWLALIVGSTLRDVGRFTLFTPGDDFSLFQRFTYRIYMQGYWLEGGQWTFWYQPLYRWIIGLVHIVFGDSSVGEWYLDAASLLVGALFAFVVCARAASFKWGMLAAALLLATIAIGPSWWVVGRDLSEITASGFAYTAALLLLTNVRRSVARVLIAGVLAVLCFYTRLNHVLWLGASVALLLPLDVRAADLWRPRQWMSTRLALQATVMLTVLGAGVLLFAWRTWYYTGVFSVLFGTQRDLVATVKPDDTFRMAIVHMIQSVLVQVTVQDPPAFDPRALVVILGIVVSLLALMRVPWCREVPAGPAVFCAASLAGALVARGTAYVGRFSIHLMPVAVAMAVCFAAHVFRRVWPAPVASTS